MKWEIEQLNTIDAWIVGSKIKSRKIDITLPDEEKTKMQHKIDAENVFFHQIVYKLAHKQRLWQHFVENDMEFFFMEIKLPCTINTDITPF